MRPVAIPKILYHGTSVRIFRDAKTHENSRPSIAPQPLYRPLAAKIDRAVFAASERWLALAFIPPLGRRKYDVGVHVSHPRFTSTSGPGGIPYIGEIEPNSFTAFNCSGYIYTLDGSGFQHDEQLTLPGEEFIHPGYVEILEEEFVPNVWEALQAESLTREKQNKKKIDFMDFGEFAEYTMSMCMAHL